MSTPTKFEKNVEAYDNCPLKVRLTEDEIHTFHEQGYLLLPKITTSEEVVWIRGIYDRLFEQRLGWDNGDLFDFAGTDDDGIAATLQQLLNPSNMCVR